MGVDFSNGYEVAGIVVGCALVIALIALLIGYIIHKLSGGKIFVNEVPTDEEAARNREYLRQDRERL